MDGDGEGLLPLIANEATVSVPAPVAIVADAVRQRHGRSVAAVLFYGSCLRDRYGEDKMVDLYVLTDGYDRVHTTWLMRTLNQLLPPNVYFIEAPNAEGRVRAKYSIVSLDHFERLTTDRTFHPYFWARFAQPTAIAWARDAATTKRVVTALARAVVTLLGEVRPLLPAGVSPRELWVRAFHETYRSELRAERSEQANRLYAAAAARYDAVAAAWTELAEESWSAGDVRRRAERHWRRRRLFGKVLSVLRLTKAALTFHDGAGYLAWKIERHSGVAVRLTARQRRHPLLTSITLFWRLYRKDAFR